MSPEIITFDKTYETRFEEYSEIFLYPSKNSSTKALDIFQEWSYYIEVAIEPIGWNALWKINRETCEKFSIPFPTVVFVMVNSINFTKLTANVEIIAVKDDTELPEIHQVPLVNLYPTQEQENAVNAYETANIIDKLRFFYDFIWQPWDRDDDSDDWVLSHLYNRISLLKDVQTGSRHLRLQFHSLIEEGRAICSRIQKLEQEVQKENENEIENVDDDDDDDAKTLELMELHLALKQVKGHFRMLENPVLRGVNKKNTELYKGQGSNSPSIVWLGGPMEELFAFLENIKNIIGKTNINTFSNVIDALKNATSNQSIFLCPGTHYLNEVEEFENDIKIIGCGAEKCILELNAISPKKIAFTKEGKITMENLFIDARNRLTSLRVVNSKLTLKSCKILGTCDVETIVILSGHLESNESEFSNARTAIVALQESKIYLNKSKISNCGIGLYACDNSKVSLKDSEIAECSEYGIDFETKQEYFADEKTSKIGSLDLLKELKEFELKNVKCDKNYADVLFHKKDNILKEIAAADTSFEEMSKTLTN